MSSKCSDMISEDGGFANVTNPDSGAKSKTSTPEATSTSQSRQVLSTNSEEHDGNEEQKVEIDVNTSASTPVLPSKRERKRTRKFEASSGESTHRRRALKTGSGVPLGQIPNISYLLNFAKGRDDELIFLHRLLFNSVGVVAKRKADIRDFSGFIFETEKDRERLKQRIAKEPTPLVRKVAQILDLPNTSSPKPALVDAITAFLENPRQDKERIDLAEKAKQKKQKRVQKLETTRSETKLAKSHKGTGKTKSSKKRKTTDTDSESATDEDPDNDDTENLESRAASASKKRANSAKKRKQAPMHGKKKSKFESDDEIHDDEEMNESENSDGPSKNEKAHFGATDFCKNLSSDQGQDTSPKNLHEAALPDNVHDIGTKGGDESDEGDDAELPTRKELSDAASALLAEGDQETLTIRSVRTRLEAQFKCSLQSRMGFLRRLVAQKLDSH